MKGAGVESPQLFDLAADIGETKDLTAAKPDVAKELQAAWARWDSELVKPTGVPASAAPRKAARAKAKPE